MSLSSPNTNAHQGLCPPPFLQENTFPSTGGFISGRFCAPIPQLLNLTCCLPCPMTDWTYRDGFEQRTNIASWINVASLVFSLVVLLSFAVLAVKWTHRHYLSICLTVAVVFMELAFLIPLGADPEQCFNEITPNDMRTSGTCAISGAFLLFGGWAVIIWVFIRALSLHLQICWEVVPGNRFFISSLVIGWLVPAIGLTLTLSLSGVSFRFGSVCHVNHKLALQDFWGPLLAFAALAMVLQFITLGYCIHVYIKSLVDENGSTQTGSRYTNSISTASARQTYRRVKKVIELQWRGATIVLCIIAEVVFFAVVFVSMDNSTQASEQMLAKALPWLTCLTQKSKDECLPLVGNMVKSEGVILSVLICLALSGFWCLLFFGRTSMIKGWADLIQRKLLRKNEFISADARMRDTRTYEMLNGASHGLSMNPPDRAYTDPTSPGDRMFASDPDSKVNYHGMTRAYISPSQSYSTPRPPSSGQQKDWDPRMTWARSHPTPSAAYRPKDFGG